MRCDTRAGKNWKITLLSVCSESWLLGHSKENVPSSVQVPSSSRSLLPSVSCLKLYCILVCFTFGLIIIYIILFLRSLIFLSSPCSSVITSMFFPKLKSCHLFSESSAQLYFWDFLSLF